jgi:hypothetical protein
MCIRDRVRGCEEEQLRSDPVILRPRRNIKAGIFLAKKAKSSATICGFT